MKAVGRSNIGLIRKRNEDSFLLFDDIGFYMVCDGMGGHRGGDVASQMAVSIIGSGVRDLQSVSQMGLDRIIELANHQIWINGQLSPEYYEMGTTLTAALINDNCLYVSHVGDSRLYIIREGKIRCITRDHTLAEEMVDNGLLNKEELPDSSYNHILTRALGASETVDIDHYTETLAGGDVILLSTDGLSDMLTDEDILSIIQSRSDSLDRAVDDLIAMALERGGYDNITAVLIRI